MKYDPNQKRQFHGVRTNLDVAVAKNAELKLRKQPHLRVR